MISLVRFGTTIIFRSDHPADVNADIKAGDDHWAEIERQNAGSFIDRLRQRELNGSDNYRLSSS